MALASAHEPERDVRKVVTALFCDMAGSTARAERLDPEAMRAVMAEYFDAMRTVIERHGGTVEKFVGDAVMALFGVPDLHEDDALRAVRAAIEMRGELERLAIPARIGINTGEVIAGGDALVTGGAINVAARLEQAAGAGQVLIGESTYELVRDAVEAVEAEPVVAKGTAEPLRAWYVVGIAAGAAGFARRMDAPLVGRERELAALRETYERCVRERRCHVITLLGAPGAGKSRLAAEFATGPAADATVLTGHCLSYGEGIAFWPIAEMVRAAAGIAEEDSAASARGKLVEFARRELDALLPEGEWLDAGAAAERVAWAIGLDDEVADAGEIAWATRKLFEWLAARAPLVLVFEDIHWAEQALLDLIDTMAELSRGAPILIICTARPELLEGRLNAASIPLEPLSEESTVQLIATRAEAARLSARRREQIVAAAEGNPLFVEQLLATVSDDGEREIAIPRTIQALLAARLESLAADERRVLECASIEGRVFQRASCEALAPDVGANEIAALLESLTRRQLIGPEHSRSAGETFRFQHQLICDAAYAHISKRDRAELHERYADWLEPRVRERAAEYEEIVAFHLERAWRLSGELEPDGGSSRAELALRAGRLLAAAGARARERGDAHSAVRLLTPARELLQGRGTARCELLLDLSRVQYANGDNAAAGAMAREALELATELGDDRLAARAELVALPVEAEASASWMEQAGRLGSLIARMTELGDDFGLALAWAMRSSEGGALMQAHIEISAAERARIHARRARQRDLELDLLPEICASCLWGAIPVGAALSRSHEALAVVADDPPRRAKVTAVIAALMAMGADVEGARALREQRTAVDADLASRMDVWFQVQHWSVVDMMSGDYAAAEAMLRASIEAMDPHSHLYGVNRDMMAHAVLAQGRFDEAEQHALESARFGRRPSAAYGADWRSIRARVIAHRGGPFDEAVSLAREASILMATTDYLNDRAAIDLNLAIVARAAGRLDEADNAFRNALRTWEDKGNSVAAANAHRLYEEFEPAR